MPRLSDIVFKAAWYFEYHNLVGGSTCRTIYVHTNVTVGPDGANTFEKLLDGGNSYQIISGCDYHHIVCNTDGAKET